MFTEQGKALAYCKVLRTFDLTAFPDAHCGRTRHFSERPIAELAGAVINMDVWTRLKVARGATSGDAAEVFE